MTGWTHQALSAAQELFTTKRSGKHHEMCLEALIGSEVVGWFVGSLFHYFSLLSLSFIRELMLIRREMLFLGLSLFMRRRT